MAEGNFGIMELLQKLLKERGTGVSDNEMGIMSGAKNKGEGYKSFIDKNKFDRSALANNNQHVPQFIDPNIPQYNNATTNALSQMRGLVPGGGAVSGKEYDFMVDGNSEGYNFTGDGVTEQAKARLRAEQGITANLGGGMDRGAVSQRETEAMRRSQLANVGMQSFGNPSDLDVSFAQALSGLSSREQMEIISATQGYNEAQVENFKRQYLQGRISPYELEAQSNLGF